MVMIAHRMRTISQLDRHPIRILFHHRRRCPLHRHPHHQLLQRELKILKSRRRATRKHPHTVPWRDLKLVPRFEVRQAPNAYILESYIPNLDQNSIKLNIGVSTETGSRVLSIEGVRYPTAEEEQALRIRIMRSLVARYGRDIVHRVTESQMDELLLQAGYGRYGKFSETYELPVNINEDEMNAKYVQGVLRVVIPKSGPYRRAAYSKPRYEDPLAQLFGGGNRDIFW